MRHVEIASRGIEMELHEVVGSGEKKRDRAAQPAHLSVHIHQKSFAVDGTSRQVIQHLHFEVDEGEFVSLLGPSGCGKTTLLRVAHWCFCDPHMQELDILPLFQTISKAESPLSFLETKRSAGAYKSYSRYH